MFIIFWVLLKKGQYYFANNISCWKNNFKTWCFSNRTIALMSVSRSNNICLVRTLRTSFPCDSINPMNDDSFVLSTFDHEDPVRTITVQGQEGHVQHAGLPDKTYKMEESQSTYIGTKNILVFTDRYNHTVYLCNIQSGSCQTVQSDKIKEPFGACPGNHGTVFVCSKNTNSVVQISPQGKIVMTHDVGMLNPNAVSLSRDGARLAVSNSVLGQMMKIKIFTVSI